jgi:hypothetical protein
VLDVLFGLAGGFSCILKALHGGRPKKKNIAFCCIPWISIKLARNTRQNTWHRQAKQPLDSEMSLYKRYRYRDESSRKNVVRILSVVLLSGMNIPGQVREPGIMNVADSSEGSRLLGVVQHHRILIAVDSSMKISRKLSGGISN